MKRVGNLFPKIVDRENLRFAVAHALRGKRNRTETRRFTAQLEANLLQIRKDLVDGTLSLGHYHQFVIHDPKKRTITAPALEERVIHHAVMNICEPVFERWLIEDTFACRAGRGRVKALNRAEKKTPTDKRLSIGRRSSRF